MKDLASINICFFGVNRSLSATIDSINKYIFGCLESCSVEYSVYGSFAKVDSYTNARSNEFDAVPEINESELIGFNGFKYVDQSAIDDQSSGTKSSGMEILMERLATLVPCVLKIVLLKIFLEAYLPLSHLMD